MAYQRWWKTVRDQQGNAINGANCAVYNGGTGTLATIYDPNTDDSAPGGLSNPFTTTANGVFGFMAADGEYDVQISGGNGATQQYRVTLNGFVSGSAASLSVDLAAPTGAGLVGFDDALTYPAGTVGEDLILPRPVSRGGTGGATAAAALANLGIIDMASEIAISSSVAMDNSYLNKSIVCNSAGAFYSPVLPASAPNGSYIQIRVAQAMPYVVLITAGGSDTIGGLALRRIRAGECWVLLKTAGNWVKVQSYSQPYRGSMCRKTSQAAIATGSFVAVDWTSAVGDTVCLDGSGRFACYRTGAYQIQVSLNIIITNPTSISQFGMGIAKNGTVLTTDPSCYVETQIPVQAGSQRIGLHTGGVFLLTEGDYLETMVRVVGTPANFDVNSVTPTLDPTLSFAEVAPW